MSQVLSVTFYGFKYGKYVYFWKKKRLYRQSPKLTIKKIGLRLYGGSLRYKIQGDYYSEEILCLLSYQVKIKELCPF